MNDWLIRRLVLDLRPVKRLRSPERRSVLFSAVALLLLTLAVALANPRTDLVERLHDPAYLVETLFLLLLFCGTAFAALRSGVPGAELTGAKLLVGLAVVVWALTIASQGVRASPPVDVRSGLSCLRRTLVMVVVPAWSLAALVRRAMPLDGRASGSLVMLAASTLAVLGTRALCARDDVSHALMWHVAPIAVLAIMGWCGGRVWLGSAAR